MTTQQDSVDVERLREALAPSGATKAAYHGEFSFRLFEGVGDDGEDMYRKVYVPWDTVKEIMAAIRARAALSLPITQRDEQGERNAARAMREACAKVAERQARDIAGRAPMGSLSESTAWAIVAAIRRLSIEQGDQNGGGNADPS